MTTQKITLKPSSPTPLYRQLADQIIDRIKSGVYSQNSALPSINAFLDVVNASRITVINALKEVASQGYITASGKRGYFVCELRETSNQFGLILPLHNYYVGLYARLYSSFHMRIKETGFDFELCVSRDHPVDFEAKITELINNGIRNLALVPPFGEGGQSGLEIAPECRKTIEEAIERHDLHVVVLDRETRPENASLIRQDRSAAHLQTIQFLSGRGYRNILFCTPHPSLEAAINSPDIARDVTVTPYAATLDFEKTYMHILKAGADAIVMNDYMLGQFLTKYPSPPFAVVGEWGSCYADICPVNYTRIDANFAEMGRLAVQLLQSNKRNQELLVPPILRVGETTPPIHGRNGQPRNPSLRGRRRKNPGE